MSDFVHIEPADGQRRAFARWALSQTPKLQTSSSTGTDVPMSLYPEVPPELLEGAYVDGFRYGGPATPPAAPVVALKAESAPAPTERENSPQAGADGPAKKPRKRAPRRPRKTADSKLTAEAMAAETGANVAAAVSDGGSPDSASK
jgi:hypothetical protein